jgi:hypothetical protein
MASYVQLLIHHPVPGKGPELRAVLEEWAKTAPSRGFEHNLMRQLGSDGLAFINGIRHENLAAFHTYPERSRANPGWEPFTKKMGSLMARPRQSVLLQTLVSPSREAPRPSFQFRITRYPAVGKWLELQALLEERAKAAQTGGFRMLSRQMFGREGTTFVTSIGFQDLASLEAFIDNNDRDAQFRAYVEKVESLTARPSKTELFQVLVPFPRR